MSSNRLMYVKTLFVYPTDQTSPLNRWKYIRPQQLLLLTYKLSLKLTGVSKSSRAKGHSYRITFAIDLLICMAILISLISNVKPSVFNNAISFIHSTMLIFTWIWCMRQDLSHVNFLRIFFFPKHFIHLYLNDTFQSTGISWSNRAKKFFAENKNALFNVNVQSDFC